MNILGIDQNILAYLNEFFVGKNPFLDKVLVFFGVYFIYTLPVILVLLWFLVKKEQRALAFSFAGMLLSWFVITKSIIPAIWFRERPDLDLIGAKEIFFHRPDYSFPSDHATALFALTFGLYLFGYKKAANWFLLYSIIICLARVIIGVHFPLDIVAGIASGLIGALVVYILQKPLEKIIWKPMIKFLKKIKLA
ncbi:MAG: phosphatase PAP2 family protein [bacterium]